MEVSWQEYWFRGTWFDNLEIYWKDLETAGPFANRTYSDSLARGHGARLADQDSGLLAVRFTVAPGSSRRVRFVISWNFPNCEDYWHPEETRGTWKNHYATRWHGSSDTARYALEDWSRLYAITDRFRGALFESTLPPVALDAVSANLAILKSPTALRLEDGTFYGWEGLHPERRVLRRQLHPRLELPASTRLPIPRAGAVYANRGLPVQPAAGRRYAL